MARAQEQFKVMAPPTEVWRKAADFGLWERFFAIDKPELKGLGGTWARIDGEGVGARIGMFSGQALAQVWEVTEWTPPQRLSLAMKQWSPEGAARVMTPLAPTARPVELRIVSGLIAQSGQLTIGIEAADVTKTTSLVTAEIEVHFTHPLFATLSALFWLFNPLKKILKRMLLSLSRQLPESL